MWPIVRLQLFNRLTMNRWETNESNQTKLGCLKTGLCSFSLPSDPPPVNPAQNYHNQLAHRWPLVSNQLNQGPFSGVRLRHMHTHLQHSASVHQNVDNVTVFPHYRTSETWGWDGICHVSALKCYWCLVFQLHFLAIWHRHHGLLADTACTRPVYFLGNGRFPSAVSAAQRWNGQT